MPQCPRKPRQHAFFHEWRYDGDFPYQMITWYENELNNCIEVFSTEQGKKFNFAKRPPSQIRCCGEAFSDEKGNPVKIGPTTFFNWCKQFDEFGRAWAYCKESTKQLYVDGGLMGAYDPTICKLVLVNGFDFKDSKFHENANTFSGGVQFSFNPVAPAKQIPCNIVPGVLESRPSIPLAIEAPNEMSNVSSSPVEKKKSADKPKTTTYANVGGMPGLWPIIEQSASNFGTPAQESR